MVTRGDIDAVGELGRRDGGRERFSLGGCSIGAEAGCCAMGGCSDMPWTAALAICAMNSGDAPCGNLIRVRGNGPGGGYGKPGIPPGNIC